MKKITAWSGWEQKINRNENLNRFFEDLRKLPLNTEKENQNYFEEGNTDALLNGNVRLIVTLAHYYSHQLSIEDLISEGFFGLTLAVNTYKRNSGTFASWATTYIRKAMLTAIEEQANVVRTPHNVEQSAQSSIDRKVDSNEDSETFADTLTASYLKVNTNVDSLATDLARVLCSILKERDTQMLCKSFGIGCNQKTNFELSLEYGMTDERVRQIISESIEKIKANKKAMKMLAKYLR